MKLKQIFLSAILLFISLQISAQDLIYRKNGEIIKAKILNITDKSLSYKLHEPAENIIYNINLSVVDSIIYENGEKETFFKKPVSVISGNNNENLNYRHHLLGADLSGYLFYKNLLFSYEYLPGKTRLGFKLAFSKNLEPWSYDGYYGSFNIGRILKWSTRIGMNYYFFPPRTFRIGTGLHYVFGSYDSYLTKDAKATGMLISFFGFYNITENLAINFGFDVPLHFNPSSSTTVIRCEIMFNF
ncbi:MAG: hypothetical protein WCI54_14700 [Bacteroidia bacterium]|jgi:hypothetical protein